MQVVRKLACKDGGSGRTLKDFKEVVDRLEIADEFSSGRSVSVEKSGEAGRDI